jgi:cytoskeletal protein RodZ
VFEIGTSLREARLRQGLDLADVERATKIRPKYLGALEHEQFELLPAQTYVKGFLRTYAEFLGLDGQLYVDEFNSRYSTGEDPDVPIRPRRSQAGTRRKQRRWVESSVVLGTLVGIAIVTALVIAAWRSGDDPVDRSPAVATSEPMQPQLVVRADNGTTLLRVREGSELGRQQFEGTLERGQAKQFPLRGRLWVWMQRPRAVELVVNGSRQAPIRSLRPQAVHVTTKAVRLAPPRR